MAAVRRRRLRCQTVDTQRSYPEDREPRWYAAAEPGYIEAERGYADPQWRGATEDRYPGEDYPVPEPRGAETGEGRHAGSHRYPEEYGAGDLGGARFDREPYGEPSRRGGVQVPSDSRPPVPTSSQVSPGVPPTGPSPAGPHGGAAQPATAGSQTYPLVAQGGGADALTGHMPEIDPRSGEYQVPGPEANRYHSEPVDRAVPRRSGGSARVGDGIYRTRRPGVAVILALLAVVFEVPALRMLLDAAFGGPVVVPGVVAGSFLTLGIPLFAMGLYGLSAGGGVLSESARFWLRPPTAYLTVGLVLFVAAALAV